MPSGAQGGAITVDVAVNDKEGRPIRGLQSQDFTLLIDKHPQPITSVRAVDLDAGTPAPPIEIVLIVDAINADLLKADRERQGIKTFLQMNGGKLAQPVSLVVLTDNAPEMHPATTDGNALATVLEQIPTGLRTINRSQGSAGTFDRFQLSIKALKFLIGFESNKPGRKLLIWISPGWPLLAQAYSDLASKDQQSIFSTIVIASTQMRLGHITMYNVETRGLDDSSLFPYYQQYLNGIKTSGDALPADLSLQVLAVQTGGLVLNKSNNLPSAIADEIAKGAQDARSFYVLSFQVSAAERPNEYHSIEVKVDKPKLIARTRTGYYAQP
jgi:VWFA-related protein